MNVNVKYNIINKIINILNKSNGRDKIYRLFQYFFKFLAFKIINNLQKLNKNDDDNKKLEIYKNISNNMSMARKLFRFGKNIALHKNDLFLIKKFFAINKNDNSKFNNILYLVFKLLANVNLALYFYSDHILFFNKIGMIKNKIFIEKVETSSNIFWFYDSIFSLISNLIELNHNNKIIILKETDDLEKINLKKRNLIIYTDILRLIFDIPTCIGFIFKNSINHEIIGLLGSCSSIIGIYQNLD